MNAHQLAHLSKPLIVLLQGPVGPFFRDLQRHLIDRGFEVAKINFNGGDWLFSHKADAENFRGMPSDWLSHFTKLVETRRPAAIVLFGDSRPYHIEALQLAQKLGITAWCLEEGYVRPDYVTCERAGNNARSPLTRSKARPRQSQLKESSNKNSLRSVAAYAIAHTLAQAIVVEPFRGNVRHRKRPIGSEGAKWALSWLRKAVFYSANRRIQRDIRTGQLRNYTVVALQVHDDLSLTRHGNGWTMERLINEAMRSFAQHAPETQHILFKVHPLDRGHRPYRKLIATAARAYGCGSRTHIADDGPIGPMIRHCDGVITVNSTSGLLALRHGKPLLALGNAVYSSAALKTLPPSSAAGLDLFWRQPSIARCDDLNAFLARMAGESLIEGSFYTSADRAATADRVAETIQREFMAEQLFAMNSNRPRFVDESDNVRIAR